MDFSFLSVAVDDLITSRKNTLDARNTEPVAVATLGGGYAISSGRLSTKIMILMMMVAFWSQFEF